MVQVRCLDCGARVDSSNPFSILENGCGSCGSAAVEMGPPDFTERSCGHAPTSPVYGGMGNPEEA